ncbi:MAG: NADPH-dependent FMN reductase [Bacteroidia bacterium]
MKIVIISGSPRDKSITRRAALHLENILREKYEVELIDLHTNDLPPMQTVFSSEEKTPPQYLALRKKMFAADAFILVSPEYNGSYSPAMKNLLDHFPKTVYARKAIGIVTASDGSFGGMRAAQQMQQLICALFGIPCPQMLIIPQVDKKFETGGKLNDETFTRNIQNFLTEYLWLAESLFKSK